MHVFGRKSYAYITEFAIIGIMQILKKYKFSGGRTCQIQIRSTTIRELQKPT